MASGQEYELVGDAAVGERLLDDFGRVSAHR